MVFVHYKAHGMKMPADTPVMIENQIISNWIRLVFVPQLHQDVKTISTRLQKPKGEWTLGETFLNSDPQIQKWVSGKSYTKRQTVGLVYYLISNATWVHVNT